jgi:putative hydrolase of the HAD superfamily
LNTANPITTLFLDIGGVILSNGWGFESRKLAADYFKIDNSEVEDRHNLVFVIYEEGRITLDEYLDSVVFYRDRKFTPDEYKTFMFDQSVAHPEMIELITNLKTKYHLKIVVVSNEAKELNEFRITKFRLNGFVDFFISSCYVHFRKPDRDIFRLALSVTQAKVEEILYIDDVQLFVEVARKLGIQSIEHTSYISTSTALADMGLEIG